MKEITKGMILGAGLGTRLKPITEKSPKPLVPVLNIPNLLFNLNTMKQAGIKDIIINLHHLGDQIEEYFASHNFGVNVSFSKEPILLGTGGGVKKAEPFFKGESFILANCDFITSVDLSSVIKFHQDKKALCTMVLHRDPVMQSFYSTVGVDKAGRLCSLPSLEIKVPSKAGIFSGVHVLDGSVFDNLLSKPSGINQTLYPALMKSDPERLFGYFMSAFWFDTGDLYFIWLTSMQLLERLFQKRDSYIASAITDFAQYEERHPGIWMDKKEKEPEDCNLVAPLLLGRHCKVGTGVQLGPFTVIGDHSEILENSKICRFVVMPNSKVEGNRHFEGGIQYGTEVLATKK